MSTSPKPAHTPEPWEQTYGAQRAEVARVPIAEHAALPDHCTSPRHICIHGQNARHATIGEAEREANAARIVACVNACAGVHDPAAAIRQAREALAQAIRDQDQLRRIAIDHAPTLCLADSRLMCAQALAALGG